MQEVVRICNDAADATSAFGRIEDELVESAKDSHYPMQFAWERTATFDTAFRQGAKDTEATAQFAIVAKASNYTFAELETLWRDVVSQAVSDGLDIEDFDSFDAHFGGDRVRIALYQMSLDTTENF